MPSPFQSVTQGSAYEVASCAPLAVIWAAGRRWIQSAEAGVGNLPWLVEATSAGGATRLPSLQRPRRAGLAGAGGEDDHAPFFQVAYRSAADVGFSHRLHLDRRLDSDHHPHPLHRIHQGQVPHRPAAGTSSDFYLIDAETPEAIVDKVLYVVRERIPQRFGLDPIADIQVLTPRNGGRPVSIS